MQREMAEQHKRWAGDCMNACVRIRNGEEIDYQSVSTLLLAIFRSAVKACGQSDGDIQLATAWYQLAVAAAACLSNWLGRLEPPERATWRELFRLLAAAPLAGQQANEALTRDEVDRSACATLEVSLRTEAERIETTAIFRGIGRRELWE
jgi:hypothetical protein